MNVLLVQVNTVWENPAATHQRVSELLRASPPERGDLVVLPELFASGFTMNTAQFAEPEGGPTERCLADLARQYACDILAGVAQKRTDGKAENRAVMVLADGSVAARYAKMQPFSGAGEDRHYAAGNEGVLLERGGTAIAPLICYDLRFPEHFRGASKAGAEVFVVLANWPYPRETHWVTLLKARAIENQAYVVGVNRAGSDPQFTYFGRSMVIDPHGEVRAEAGSGETVLRAKLDIAEIRKWREAFPALRDRRY